MALSQIIKQECPACKKIAVEVTRVSLGKTALITLQCGHLVTEGQLGSADDVYTSIISTDGRTLMPYQIEGVKFLEQANARAILADMQGLGKTVQVSSLLRIHRKELFPAIIVPPATVKLHWHHELIRWMGEPKPLVQVIGSGKEFAAPGFDVYVISYDMLKNDEYILQIVRDNIKTVIIDECQRIKNHLSERAKAIQRVCKNVEHIIPMSGTPIKNHAGEYFTILNLVRPRKFPQYQGFIDKYCDAYNNGWAQKIGGLKDPQKFKDDTEDFIIRRTKDEVLKDMPTFSRRFKHVELDGKVKKAYVENIKLLEDVIYDDSMTKMQAGAAKIAIFSKLRHLTGLSKMLAAEDEIKSFIESNDEKLVVFTHHQDVMDLLSAKCDVFLKEMGLGDTLVYHSGLNADARHALIRKFRDDSSRRLMIISTLAGGEGLDGLQYVCYTGLMLERQWNPANEEQTEARLHRYGQTKPVIIDYMICSETIDEYFTELVEQKRAIVAGALDNKEYHWDEAGLMSELAMILVTKGKKAWKL